MRAHEQHKSRISNSNSTHNSSRGQGVQADHITTCMQCFKADIPSIMPDMCHLTCGMKHPANKAPPRYPITSTSCADTPITVPHCTGSSPERGSCTRRYSAITLLRNGQANLPTYLQQADCLDTAAVLLCCVCNACMETILL